jgi:glycosyltransferase involved in cell wall biosynthesis
MKIILISHPDFLGSQSMPRYAQMIYEGMKLRGHRVTIWSPKAVFYRLPLYSIKKWLGYIDQFLIFPLIIKLKLTKTSNDTLIVFADQALGPWVPLATNRPHVVHCHDFLALKSALGQVPENPVSFTGKLYQKFIQKGFSKGLNFISVSQKTQQDLSKFHLAKIIRSEVHYNGMNRVFKHLNQNQSRKFLIDYLDIPLNEGYIMHIGGNQYYKNRCGVIEIYEEFRLNDAYSIPLVLIGQKPDKSLLEAYNTSEFKKDIYFILSLGDEFINYAYSGATCLLFPSLDEGFGWPIAEAMASGCIVITTNRAPMNEVLGEANIFSIDRKSSINTDSLWAKTAAEKISNVMRLNNNEREEIVKIGLESSKRFDSEIAIEKIESMYLSIISTYNK